MTTDGCIYRPLSVRSTARSSMSSSTRTGSNSLPSTTTHCRRSARRPAMPLTENRLKTFASKPGSRHGRTPKRASSAVRTALRARVTIHLQRQTNDGVRRDGFPARAGERRWLAQRPRRVVPRRRGGRHVTVCVSWGATGPGTQWVRLHYARCEPPRTRSRRKRRGATDRTQSSELLRGRDDGVRRLPRRDGRDTWDTDPGVRQCLRRSRCRTAPAGA